MINVARPHRRERLVKCIASCHPPLLNFPASTAALRDKTIAVLDLTFKPNTDDMREAPSIPLITALQDMGALGRAFDPVGMEHTKAILPDVVYCDGPYSCADGGRRVVIVTNGRFRALDFNLIKQRMASPLLVDLRNIYSSDEMERHGFLYVGIGRKVPRHDLRL